jgi:hypothetical protein
MRSTRRSRRSGLCRDRTTEGECQLRVTPGGFCSATDVLTEQVLAPAAVEAVPAELGIVGCDTVSDGEALDFLDITISVLSIMKPAAEVYTGPMAAMTPTVSCPGISGNFAMNSPS